MMKVTGPDADGLYWIHGETGQYKGTVSVRADSIIGRAFAGYVGAPVAPEGRCRACDGPMLAGATPDEPRWCGWCRRSALDVCQRCGRDYESPADHVACFGATTEGASNER
jgi:hypothetical protein